MLMMCYSMEMQHFRDARRVMAEWTALRSSHLHIPQLGKIDHHQQLIWNSEAIEASIFQRFLGIDIYLKTLYLKINRYD